MDKLWMAPQGLHVEPAETGDAGALAQLHGQCFYRGWPIGDFAGFIADKTTPTYIACDAKRRIAGFALIRAVADEAELLTIAVEPKWRDKGVGRALMHAAFADLMLSPAQRMFLEVEERNASAIALYKRLGFTTIASRDAYYAQPEGAAVSALVMARDLG